MTEDTHFTAANAVAREEGDFPARDGTRLYACSARPVPPGGAPCCRARVCLLPGYGDHGGRYGHVLDYLAARGVAASALDFRGQGRAGGRRGYARRWDDYLDDLAAFLGHEAAHWGGKDGPPRFLLCQSHGALVAVHAALEGRMPPDVRGAVFTAPFLRLKAVPPAAKLRLARAADRVLPWLPIPTDVPKEWMTDDPQMRAADRADPLSISIATPRWFLAVLAKQEEALRRAGEFSLPLRLIAGDRDELADSTAARQFCEQAGSADRSFGHYPGLRHEPLRETRRDAVLADILSWLRARTDSVL